MKIEQFAKKSRTKVTKDGNFNQVIHGRRGNIHEDGDGLSVFVSMKTPKSIEKATESVTKFAVRKQDGDREAVYFIAKNLSESEAVVICKLCRIRQKKQYSAEVFAKMTEQGKALASKIKDRNAKQAQNNQKSVEPAKE